MPGGQTRRGARAGLVGAWPVFDFVVGGPCEKGIFSVPKRPSAGISVRCAYPLLFQRVDRLLGCIELDGGWWKEKGRRKDAAPAVGR